MMYALPSAKLISACETFKIYLEGEDPSGMPKQLTHTWETADTMKRLALIQVILVIKLVQWMQPYAVAMSATWPKRTLALKNQTCTTESALDTDNLNPSA